MAENRRLPKGSSITVFLLRQLQERSRSKTSGQLFPGVWQVQICPLTTATDPLGLPERAFVLQLVTNDSYH